MIRTLNHFVEGLFLNLGSAETNGAEVGGVGAEPRFVVYDAHVLAVGVLLGVVEDAAVVETQIAVVHPVHVEDDQRRVCNFGGILSTM